MDIITTQFNHCALIKASGRIDSYTAPQLASAFNAITAEKKFKIVFDMETVEYMSSAGLRVLMSVQKACKRYNRGEIVLCGVPKRIYDALDLAGFAPLFKIFNDSTTAVGYF